MYEQWFEYAKASPLGYPKEFGDLEQFKTFKEWWDHPDYGFELFCEPYIGDPVQLLDRFPKKKLDNHLYLSIDLSVTPSRSLQMLKNLIKKHEEEHNYTPASRARFQPSMPLQFIKPQKLATYLKTWHCLENEGLSRIETAIKMGFIPPEPPKDSRGQAWYLGAIHSAERKVTRHKRSVTDAFKQIKKGTFP
ncbi:hypothetical protein BOW53_04210 [Solemya pervernicosa gill symbiont]|uniref:Uncharacterized protein n=1 Tax=Solemya pervernicosa gill symbiont TaxID=642797 RepID=A0A1T2L8A1_9GAMM|nr:hypothetical protein [Solemya pervernicosa gill symbiont]OOZ41327.1 hypothetical protein BOW53_04210 [Solemya pervernicosa gill symbiont]